MNLKDWEIYQRTKSLSESASIPRREHASDNPEMVMEFRQVASEIEKLPDEYILLATRILKQFLR